MVKELIEKKFNVNYPKISIITPSYNQGDYLEDTILSVLGQNYPNMEYLIYDGGSNDNSVDIIKKYSSKLAYWISEKDKGQADAINKGFSKCDGDILMWLNSDDILMPNVLHYIANTFLKLGDGIYFGNCIHFKEHETNGVFAIGSNVSYKFNSDPLELSDSIIQPSSFWSKTIWLKNGPLIEDFHYGFDWEWFLRAKKNNIPFYTLNKPISLYRFHDAHKSSVGGVKRQDELFKIYSMYSSKYAKLYQLIREEKFQLTKLDKVLIFVGKFLFKRNLNKTQLLKIKKRKHYKEFTVKEMEAIRGML